MSWEELFESRMLDGRITKSTIDNPYDKFIDQIPGLKDNELCNCWKAKISKERYSTTGRTCGLLRII